MKFKSIFPYTGELIKEHQPLSPDEVELKINFITAARKRSSLSLNADKINQLALVLKERKAEFSNLITLETGKLIGEAEQEVEKCALCCEFYAQNSAGWLKEESLPLAGAYLRREPLGLVLGIMPWNFPFWQVFRFAIPAIAAGNSVLIKHAPNTMACSFALEEIFHLVGFEGNYLNLPIPIEQVESVLRRVQAVSLTGSSRAGSAVAQLAGKHLKKCVLELGGSDAFIALEDADMKLCVEAAFRSRMINAGQSCIAAKRFIVVEKIFDWFVEQIIEKLQALNDGDPREPTTTLAPLARLDLKLNLENQLNQAINDGAKLVFRHSLSSGICGFSPAIIHHQEADPDEFFGPVFHLIKVKDANQAVEFANQSRYGLGASIWTNDLQAAKTYAQQLHCGSVFVNSIVRSDPKLPFGGVKDSGIGRELSYLGLYEFCNPKTIVVS